MPYHTPVQAAVPAAGVFSNGTSAANASTYTVGNATPFQNTVQQGLYNVLLAQASNGDGSMLQAREKFVDMAFDALDRNKDGVLSRSEFNQLQAMPEVPHRAMLPRTLVFGSPAPLHIAGQPQGFVSHATPSAPPRRQRGGNNPWLHMSSPRARSLTAPAHGPCQWAVGAYPVPPILISPPVSPPRSRSPSPGAGIRQRSPSPVAISPPSPVAWVTPTVIEKPIYIDRERIVERPVYIEKIVEKVVEKRVPVYVDRIVEKIVRRDVPVYVDRDPQPVYQDRVVEKIVHRDVPVYIEKVIEREIDRPVEKIVYRDIGLPPHISLFAENTAHPNEGKVKSDDVDDFGFGKFLSEAFGDGSDTPTPPPPPQQPLPKPLTPRNCGMPATSKSVSLHLASGVIGMPLPVMPPPGSAVMHQGEGIVPLVGDISEPSSPHAFRNADLLPLGSHHFSADIGAWPSAAWRPDEISRVSMPPPQSAGAGMSAGSALYPTVIRNSNENSPGDIGAWPSGAWKSYESRGASAPPTSATPPPTASMHNASNVFDIGAWPSGAWRSSKEAKSTSAMPPPTASIGMASALHHASNIFDIGAWPSGAWRSSKEAKPTSKPEATLHSSAVQGPHGSRSYLLRQRPSSEGPNKQDAVSAGEDDFPYHDPLGGADFINPKLTVGD